MNSLLRTKIIDSDLLFKAHLNWKWNFAKVSMIFEVSQLGFWDLSTYFEVFQTNSTVQTLFLRIIMNSF